jgi:hypothetical protein
MKPHLKIEFDLILRLASWLELKATESSSPMREWCQNAACLAQQFVDEFKEIWDQIKVVEKKVRTVPVSGEFYCQRCRETYMRRGTPQTVISEGDRAKRPDGTEFWRDVDITFVCPKCEPIEGGEC